MACFHFAYIEIDHSWLLLSELYTKDVEFHYPNKCITCYPNKGVARYPN